MLPLAAVEGTRVPARLHWDHQTATVVTSLGTHDGGTQQSL